ncbi:MAG: class I SAM-dependent methyltransferase [Flavobacteriales bacterium]
MTNSDNVNKGFSSIYEEYDRYENVLNSATWKRKRVYAHVSKFMEASDSILELNAGSGIDAVHFAKQGHRVFATDISDGFLDFLKTKVEQEKLSHLIDYQQFSFDKLDALKPQKFNYIFSNKGGLNCIEDLESTINQFDDLLHDGGKVSLVIMPKHNPWEWLKIFKNRKQAFRRYQNHLKANVDGYKIKVWYHPLSQVKAIIKKKYDILNIENLGIFFPESNDFHTRHKNTFRFLIWFNKFLAYITPKGIGDYYIVTFRKKSD